MVKLAFIRHDFSYTTNMIIVIPCVYHVYCLWFKNHPHSKKPCSSQPYFLIMFEIMNHKIFLRKVGFLPKQNSYYIKEHKLYYKAFYG
jgi:hypothetical protein